MNKIKHLDKNPYQALRGVEEEKIHYELPKNIWLVIFSFLNSPHQLTKIGRVCRTWRVLSNNQMLWKKVASFMNVEPPSTRLSEINWKNHCLEAICNRKFGNLAAKTPQINFTESTNKPITAFAVYEDSIFAVTEENRLYVFDIMTGKITKKTLLSLDKIKDFRITKMKVFKTHLTLFVRWNKESRLFRGVASLNSETYAEIYSCKFPERAFGVEIHEKFIYLKWDSCLYELEFQKFKAQLILNNLTSKEKVLLHSQIVLQNKNKTVEVVNFPDKRHHNFVLEGKLLQADEKMLITYVHNPSLVIRFYNLEDFPNYKCLNLQHSLHHCFHSDVHSAQILGDILLVLIDYDNWINEGKIQFIQSKVLIVIDKNNGKILQTIYLNASINRYVMNFMGRIILFSKDKPQQFSIVNCFKEEPPSKKCLLF